MIAGEADAVHDIGDVRAPGNQTRVAIDHRVVHLPRRVVAVVLRPQQGTAKRVAQGLELVRGEHGLSLLVGTFTLNATRARAAAHRPN